MERVSVDLAGPATIEGLEEGAVELAVATGGGCPHGVILRPVPQRRPGEPWR